MKFNGIQKPYIGVLRGRIRPFFAPLSRSSKFDSSLIQTDRGHRIVEVPVFIKYDDIPQFRSLTEDIAGWLVHDEPKILEFKDEPDRLYFAVVDDTIRENIARKNGTDVVIKFICGYKYSLERNLPINTTATNNIDGHKSTSWRTKTTFTANQTGYEVKFNAPGKSNLRDICKIKLNFNFQKGDVLQIDYRKRRVTLNGNDITNTVVILQSNFMELPIGQVEFTANHQTEFYYHERYY
ncbi:distal tail protein Dit [Lederbergia lenta]|uniref:distal tail protein Dit n=1 Tax=Lederbergia lenta TaxID=1467 RepID=UPI002040B224|nr:distal tail protein Dit [Lederbergia lenta]MCM3111687.1 phage tail family protein [Lederbergia lenta]